jgi:hypothetical protein
MYLIVYLFRWELSTFLLVCLLVSVLKKGQTLRFRNACPLCLGGDEGDRTPGLGVANAALSQLSYIPIFIMQVLG